MSVTEIIRGLGAWTLEFENVPSDISDQIQYFGHVAIHTGRINYRKQGDGALTSSRYTGVLRKKELVDGSLTIGGAGMGMWLGDEDQKGPQIEAPLTITSQTFENSIRAVLTASGTTAVTEGTLFSVPGLFTGAFVFSSARQAIDYLCDTMGGAWLVRGDGTIMAGLESDLYVTNPKTVVFRRTGGEDMFLKGFLGTMKTDQDVEDFTTRVVLLASGVEGSVVTAAQDINPGINPYKDIHGNTVKMTRFVSESTTDATNAPARAQLQLNRFSGTRDALTLDSADYDIKGDLSVGDYLWVHDEQIGLVDGDNEVKFRGALINPMKLRLTEMTWAVTNKYSVGFRNSQTGVWYDLTDYLIGESETTTSTLVVGGYNRSLTSGGADGGVAGTRPLPNLTIPGQPTWVTSFIQSVYQSPGTGDTKAQTVLAWTRPANTDGSAITDGDHYEIRWRTSTTPLFPVTWSQLSGKTWGQLKASGATWGSPLQYVPGQWSYSSVGWDQLTFNIQELTANMPYEAEIRAVDGAIPSNYGDWSPVTTWQTSGDTLPPATPAPAQVFASRIAAQIVHTLGRSSGGTYNLDPDLHHLEIHGEYEPDFIPSDATNLGKIIANNGMITGHIPAVGTVPIESTAPVYFKVIAVDMSGNKSNPSVAVMQTAELIDDAHIDSLTVSKVTAGTITADWLVAARIATGFTGARAEMNSGGFEAYDPSGVQTFDVNSSTGGVDSIGSIKSGVAGVRVEVNPNVGAYLPEIRMYPTTGATFAVINAVNAGSVAGIGVNSGSTDGVIQSTMYCSPTTAFIGRTHIGIPAPGQGGYYFGNATDSRIGYLLVGGNDAFFNVGSDRRLGFKGVFFKGAVFGPEQAIVVDNLDCIGPDGMFTGWSAGFGATMANEVNVFVSVQNFSSGGGVQNQGFVDSLNQVGFGMGSGYTTPANGGRFSFWMAQTG